MIKSLPLFFLFAFLSINTSAQTKSQRIKECRISSGFGFSSAEQNVKKIGTALWIQLDYRLSENFSLATEFEFMAYKQFGYYETLPVDPNEIKVYDNNFSILVKYHFPTKSKINVSLASGWTYTIRQNDYYYFEDNGTTKHWFPNITSYSDYTIPFLAEIGYPISKKNRYPGKNEI